MCSAVVCGVCFSWLSCAEMCFWLDDGEPYIVLETSNAGNLDLLDSCGCHHDNNHSSFGSSYNFECLCAVCFQVWRRALAKTVCKGQETKERQGWFPFSS